jgi:hypothetical protein
VILIQAKPVLRLMQKKNTVGYNMSDKDKYYYNYLYSKKAIKSKVAFFYSLLGIILLILFSLLLSGCKSVQYIPVEKVKTEYKSKTDTITKIDSIFSEKETIIREADSSLIIKLGLKLKANERAVLILQKELEKKISKESESKTDTIIKVDSVQIPYPVEKKLTKWEKVKMDMGGFAIGLLVVLGLLIIMIVCLVRVTKK